MLPAANTDKQTALFTIASPTSAPRAINAAGAENTKREGPSFGSILAKLSERGAAREQQADSQGKALTENDNPEETSAVDGEVEGAEAAAAEGEADAPEEGGFDAQLAAAQGEEAAKVSNPDAAAKTAQNKATESADLPVQDAGDAADEDAIATPMAGLSGYASFAALPDSDSSTEAAAATSEVSGADADTPVARGILGEDGATVAADSSDMSAVEGEPAQTLDARDATRSRGTSDEFGRPTPVTGEAAAKSQPADKASAGVTDGPRLPAAEAMFQSRFTLTTRSESARASTPSIEQVAAPQQAAAASNQATAAPVAAAQTAAAPAQPGAEPAAMRDGAKMAGDVAPKAAIPAGESPTPAAPQGSPREAAAATTQTTTPTTATSAAAQTTLKVTSEGAVPPAEGKRLDVAPELRARVTVTRADAGSESRREAPASPTLTSTTGREPSTARADAYLAMRAMSAPARTVPQSQSQSQTQAAAATQPAGTLQQPAPNAALPDAASAQLTIGLPAATGPSGPLPGQDPRQAGAVADMRTPRERARDQAADAAPKAPTPTTMPDLTASAGGAMAQNGGGMSSGSGNGDKSTAIKGIETEIVSDSSPLDMERGSFEALARTEQTQRNDPAQARQAPGAETARQVASQIGAHLEGPDAVKTANGGFDLRLDPDELGQIRLRLVTHDGSSTLFVQADRPETMDLMRRHIAALEQDLRAMGHSNLTLQFSGSGAQGQNWSGGQAQSGHRGNDGGSFLSRPAEMTDTAARPAPTQTAQRLGARDSLDLRL